MCVRIWGRIRAKCKMCMWKLGMELGQLFVVHVRIRGGINVFSRNKGWYLVRYWN